VSSRWDVQLEHEQLLVLWGKQKVADGLAIYYPLLWHMLDTAACAWTMWDVALHRGTRSFLGEGLGVDQATACQLVVFLAGTHDIGKASPGFQYRASSSDRRKTLASSGFEAPRYTSFHVPHGYLSSLALEGILSRVGLDPECAHLFAIAVGGHHGVFPRSSDLEHKTSFLGSERFSDARLALSDIVGSTIACGAKSFRGVGSLPRPAVLVALAGLISVCDWLASNEGFFPLRESCEGESPSQHIENSLRSAHAALRRLGWSGWMPRGGTETFSRTFPQIGTPYPLQKEIEALAKAISTEPGIVVIEAPTGEGKTEAALYLMDCIVSTQAQRGCYVAMPTMATSNQMFSRVLEFLEKRYHGDNLPVMLLHGHADLSAEMQSLLEKGARLYTVESVDDDGISASDGATGTVMASEWFTYRKRGLLAPFGVGTVDQAMLSVLQTRHGFVRLFGLAGKTVIVDEVHAYDVYMTTIIGRLLEWLASLGTSVILLSATLPASQRVRLLAAYRHGLGETVAPQPVESPYPRVTWSTRTTSGTKGFHASVRASRVVMVRLLVAGASTAACDAYGDDSLLGGCCCNDDHMGMRTVAIARLLASRLENGGCAAVICNTVTSAQETYRALKRLFEPKILVDRNWDVFDLFHARYPWDERQRREQRVLQRFGRYSSAAQGCGETEPRPHRSILVATQIIEQSLDLDFDLIVSDIAPVDLLLQRAGRLWRHEGNDRHGVSEHPELWLIPPEYVDGQGKAVVAGAAAIPRFDEGTCAVYDEHLLLRSWLALLRRAKGRNISLASAADHYHEGPCPSHRNGVAGLDWLALPDCIPIKLPDDTEGLLENVYDESTPPDDLPLPLREEWIRTRRQLEEKLERQGSLARQKLSPSPLCSSEDFVESRNQEFDEDDAAAGLSVAALTRLGLPSLSLLCLYERGGRLFVDDAFTRPAWLDKSDRPDVVRQLLGRSVTLSGTLARALAAELEPCSLLRKCSHLRHHRIVALDASGMAQVGPFSIRLDNEYGLTIERSDLHKQASMEE